VSKFAQNYGAGLGYFWNPVELFCRIFDVSCKIKATGALHLPQHRHTYSHKKGTAEGNLRGPGSFVGKNTKKAAAYAVLQILEHATSSHAWKKFKYTREPRHENANPKHNRKIAKTHCIKQTGNSWTRG
jgi:hypothetical protein